MEPRTIGEAIRIARERNNMSQQALADAIYSTQQAISSYECGEHVPSFDTVRLIQDALDCDFDMMLELDQHDAIERAFAAVKEVVPNLRHHKFNEFIEAQKRYQNLFELDPEEALDELRDEADTMRLDTESAMGYIELCLAEIPRVSKNPILTFNEELAASIDENGSLRPGSRMGSMTQQDFECERTWVQTFGELYGQHKTRTRDQLADAIMLKYGGMPRLLHPFDRIMKDLTVQTLPLPA